VPLSYYFVFHHKGNLNKIPARIWAIAGFIAFIFFPIFLFRKHWEKAMVFAKNTFWFVAGVAQMDNNFWETLAKLLTLLVLLALNHKNNPEIYKRKSSSTQRGFAPLNPRKDFFLKPGEMRGFPSSILGYWVGLGYGIGEAITLSIIGFFPVLNRIFGIALFMYFTTWHTVWERAYAVQIHAIIGALVGIGFYHWSGLGKKFWLLFFFILGVLYHELVDGLVLVMMYYPNLKFAKFLGSHFLSITLPVLLVIGYFILLISYRASRSILITVQNQVNPIRVTTQEVKI